ncbi:hypothetical protein Naga_100004g55 [Nannochloropsis gaditana]|uniref:Uncharacterized protein n=1 Tax=Nannochloropsis gaditana TaxID=72520 RepID=W7U647_9STRA|nr:hypothetical protein Naga_100004g55 [Nannochloropsis gaditana]
MFLIGMIVTTPLVRWPLTSSDLTIRSFLSQTRPATSFYSTLCLFIRDHSLRKMEKRFESEVHYVYIGGTMLNI